MSVLTIAGRELRSLFLSPLAWSILAVVQAILAYVFLLQIERFMTLQPRLAALEAAPGVTDLVVAPLLHTAVVVVLLVTPLITMRVFAEERRARTLTLLLTAPVSMSEIVLGKYLGILTFMLVVAALTALMPLSLLAGTELDLGRLGAGVLGLVLLVAAFTAAGLFFSSLTEQPTVAAVTAFGLLLLLWIIDWAAVGEGGGALRYLSLLNHYEALLDGLVVSTDVIYYGLLVALFLGLTIRRLDAERLPR